MQSSDWIALASLVIALCALVTSVWQGLVAMKHARLSARPIIEAETNTHENPGLALTNCGFGPAILCKLVAHIDGQSINLFTDAGHTQLAESLVDNQVQILSVRHCVPRLRSAIAAGQRIQVTAIPAACDDENLARELGRRFRRMTLEIEYESIYGETFSDKHAFKDTA